MEFRIVDLDFSSLMSGSGPRTASTTVVFPRAVKTAVVGITGYSVAFRNDGQGRPLGRMVVSLNTLNPGDINLNTVTITGNLGLRDWSGEWDDQYQGGISVAVVAELESASAAPPRSDLIITEMELNQATQFFRSAAFLDPTNVRPDNSVFLVARKDTGIRVYIDWDSSAGLPTITNLTGELTVQTGSTSFVLQPINLGQAILPKNDVNINQSQANDTLNFMIPGAWCTGSIEISCQVFDKAAPDSKSGIFSRTLVFYPTEPLRLYLIGVGLTTPYFTSPSGTTPLIAAPPAAAPTQAEITSALWHLFRTYPRGDILQTGYMNINFDIDNYPFDGPNRPIRIGPTAFLDIAAPGSCTLGFISLNQALLDMRGSSSDIYLGGLPSGLAFLEDSNGHQFNNCLGCASVGSGAAAAFIDTPTAISHEVGHALGRLHDPGKSYARHPTGVDWNYPQYDNFDSDSIGVYGFDPNATDPDRVVYSPQTTYDFMTAEYSPDSWISPYTYQGLLGNSVGGPSTGGGSPSTNSDAPIETLFLGLWITRKREVTVRPSFHFQAPPQGCSGFSSQFSVEFLDHKHRVLGCAPLHCGCAEEGCSCWPKYFSGALFMPSAAKGMVVWERDKKIHEESIPKAPAVSITAAKSQQDGVLLNWKSNPSKNVTYLVHWFDQEMDVFRGVAPRLQKTSLLIPKELFTHGSDLLVREKISTGVTQHTIKLKNYRQSDETIVLIGTNPQMREPQQIPDVIKAQAVDSAGRQLSLHRANWFDGKGKKIARGGQLDLRAVGFGSQIIRMVVRNANGRMLSNSWLIKHKAGSSKLLRSFTDSADKLAKRTNQLRNPNRQKLKK